MILIVDDDLETRLVLFQHQLGAAPFLFRACPEEVTDADLQAASVLFLDHDMPQGHGWNGTCPRPNAGEGCRCPTGLDLARRIAEGGLLVKQASIYCHSWNHAGADAIHKILRDAGYSNTFVAPFGLETWRGVLRSLRASSGGG